MDQLKVAHECYTHLKTRAKRINMDEGASNTTVEDLIEDLKDYASRTLTHAIEANQQALRGLR